MKLLATLLGLRASTDRKDARRSTSFLVNTRVEAVLVVDARGMSATSPNVAYALDSQQVAPCFDVVEARTATFVVESPFVVQRLPGLCVWRCPSHDVPQVVAAPSVRELTSEVA